MGAPSTPISGNLLDRVTAHTESGGHDFTRAGSPLRSPKGALFGMQVMPATARDPGFGLSPANVNDPNDMNRLGREYRAKMEQRYGGNLAQMWSAYNAGPGRTDRALQHGADWFNHVPAETRNYITQNMRKLRGGQ